MSDNPQLSAGEPVRLGPPDPDLDAFASEAAQANADVARALELARVLGSLAPRPGRGETLRLWRLLASLGAADLTAARTVEAHLDALSILSEHGGDGGVPASRAWGVFAAEASGVRLDARRVDGGWILDGVKPWCSLAGRLDSALVTAHTPDGRRLFSVSMKDPGTRVRAGGWVSRGLVAVDSSPVEFHEVPAAPVGEAGWYLTRPGFAWGGMGVAACWFGGAVGVARALLRAAQRREPDQVGAMHLGRIDAALHAARSVLEAAADRIDAGRADAADGAALALRVRHVVADAAEAVLSAAGHALGPAPLTQDDDHARRVADLTVYVRQHHAERDSAALGRAVAEAAGTGVPNGVSPW